MFTYRAKFESALEHAVAAARESSNAGRMQARFDALEPATLHRVTRWCDCEVSYLQPADVLAPVTDLCVDSICGWYHATKAQAMRDLEIALSSVTDGRVRTVLADAL